MKKHRASTSTSVPDFPQLNLLHSTFVPMASLVGALTSSNRKTHESRVDTKGGCHLTRASVAHRVAMHAEVREGCVHTQCTFHFPGPGISQRAITHDELLQRRVDAEHLDEEVRRMGVTPSSQSPS